MQLKIRKGSHSNINSTISPKPLKVFFILFVLTLIFCFEILFLNKTWFPTYILKQMYPWKSTLQSDKLYYDGGWNLDAFRDWYRSRIQFKNYVINKELPLWDNTRLWGTPHLADGLSTPFDPMNIVFLIFPTNYAFNIYTSLQFFIAGYLMYLLVRSLRISFFGAFLSATVYAFSYESVWLSGFPHFYNSLVWTPLVFYSAIKYQDTNNKKYITLLFLGIVLQFLSGSFELTLYSLMFLIFFNKFFLKRNHRHISINKNVVSIIAVIILAISSVSFQLLPTFELAQRSSREVKASTNLRSAPPLHFISIFNPLLFGSPLEKGRLIPSRITGRFTNYYEPQFWHNFYINGIVLGLIPLAFFHKSKWKKRIVLCLAIAAIWTISGPIYNLLFSKIPIVNNIQTPERMVYYYFFFSCVLVGFGFDFVTKIGQNKAKFSRINIIKGMKIIGAIIIAFNILTPPLIEKVLNIPSLVKIVLDNFSLVYIKLFIPLLVQIAAITTIVFFLKNRINKKTLAIFLLVIAFSESVFIRSQIKTTDDLKNLFPTTPGLKYLMSQRKPTRVVVVSGFKKPEMLDYSEILEPNLLSIYNIPEISGHGALNTKASFDYITRLGGDGGSNRRMIPVTKINTNALLNSGIEFIIVTPGYKLRNDDLKLAYKGSDMNIYKNSRYKGIASFDGSGNVNIDTYRNNNITLNVDARSQGKLVLFDQNYLGWNAYIDGKKQELDFRSFFRTLRSILPGKHIVKYTYQPVSFKIGLVISMLSFSIFIIWQHKILMSIILPSLKLKIKNNDKRTK